MKKQDLKCKIKDNFSNQENNPQTGDLKEEINNEIIKKKQMEKGKLVDQNIINKPKIKKYSRISKKLRRINIK